MKHSFYCKKSRRSFPLVFVLEKFYGLHFHRLFQTNLSNLPLWLKRWEVIGVNYNHINYFQLFQHLNDRLRFGCPPRYIIHPTIAPKWTTWTWSEWAFSRCCRPLFACNTPALLTLGTASLRTWWRAVWLTVKRTASVATSPPVKQTLLPPGESSPSRTDSPPALPPEKGGQIITITISDAGMSPGSSSLAAAVLLDLLYPFNSTSAPECRRKADGLSSTTKHPPDSTGCLTTLNAMFWTGRSLSNLG